VIHRDSRIRQRRFLQFAICIFQFSIFNSHCSPAPAADPLREAIEDLTRTHADDYPHGKEFLQRLDHLQQRLADAPPDQLEPLNTELESLRREALLANPLLCRQPILFVVRPQYTNNHGTEATMCQTGEINTDQFRGGGAMKTIDFADGVRVTTLLELPKGVARDPEVSFDGKRIVFSMRRDIEDDYHLYEINTDGSGLRQITFGRRVSDIQPVIMPDGRVVFSSTRDPKYIPCQRHLMCNLFTVNADGSNVRQLGHNTQFEGRASLMDDGRILYTRWEYVDKHYASAYGLWTINPDGTNPALYYGGYAWQPGAIADAREIPGTGQGAGQGTGQFVCIYTTVHNLGYGAMVVADRRVGLDGTRPIVQSWPADISAYMSVWEEVGRVGGGGFDSFMRLPVAYEDPMPLSEKYFLCARMTRPKGPMGLFLADVFGNEILLHFEAPGCFDPMPIGPRQRPPVVPEKIDLTRSDGTFYVEDVYRGRYMDRVERGTVKTLRIVEAPAKRAFPPWSIGDWTPALNADGHHPVAVNWGHYNHKRIVGDVPVEADGSAHFAVPADRFVYFQLLDEDGMMVHSMRSGTFVQPGETLGCVGCHDDRQASPPVPRGQVPIAWQRPPNTPEPWYGEARNFSYAAEVQPVLDEHCVRCHDYGKEAEELNLCGDLGPAFSVSYTSLRSRSPAVWQPQPDDAAQTPKQKPLIYVVDAGPIRVIPPYSWGSHASRLVDLLLEGHEDVKLDDESLARIVTWIDLNTPYYPSHVTYYGTNTFGRCPLDHKQLTRLGSLVAAAARGAEYRWGNVNSYNVAELSRLVMTRGTPINFTRPRHSLCLNAFDNLDGPEYAEALAIIQAGRQMLADHPRADMPGFRPREDDRRRLDDVALRQQIEARNRQAILSGEKLYSADVATAPSDPQP